MPAITLSGFNNIDFNAILEAVMTQERVPLTNLQTKQKALQQQNTQLGTLAAKLSTLQAAAEGLSTPDGLAVLSAKSSDESLVGVSTSTGSTPGAYDIKVTDRAKAQVTASTSTSAAADVIATSGTLQMLALSQPPVTIVVTGSMTMRQLADAINANADAPVTATVVQVAPGRYRLVLTAKQTGADNAFTFTSTLAGGTGVTFDDDGNQVYGEAADNNAVDASNAHLTVNGVAVESASNTLSDVIPGATVTLNGEDATKIVRVSVNRDADALRKKVDTLVKSYNDLVAFVNEQRTAAVSGDASVGRDPLVRGLHTDLRSTLLGEYGDAAVSRLAGIGIGFNRSGLMTVDGTVFSAAVSSDPASVHELFAGASGSPADGAFDAVSDLVAKYTSAGGLVKKAQTRIDEQVKSIAGRIDTLDAQLNIRRNALQAEFIAADQAMQRLNGQVNSLSSLNGQYRLF